MDEFTRDKPYAKEAGFVRVPAIPEDSPPGDTWITSHSWANTQGVRNSKIIREIRIRVTISPRVCISRKNTGITLVFLYHIQATYGVIDLYILEISIPMVKNFVDKFKIGLVEPGIGLNSFVHMIIIITYYLWKGKYQSWFLC